ncbi:hypothetical protein I6I10_07100 [Corynebacterium glucuronolyticum]|uniref:Uncharacterized protein n=1 Tax=Corynebacterium glucuronolyticum TaxID=39791 RepID=A0A7T4EDF0_9CORY|nr:hypothetical protein [Corynebacterium glucuronolyticum]QQB45306.1 hypothetical protein I6I10_07100 [Corynebacterium glucuronolyticum]
MAVEAAAGVDVDSRKRTSLDVTVPVLIPSGVAIGVEQTGKGAVEVENSGDVTIYPRIAYTGRAAKLRVPPARFSCSPLWVWRQW